MPVSRTRTKRPNTKRTASTMPVVRAEGYQRYFADQAFVMPLGRDVDIAFVAVGSTLDRVVKTTTADDIVSEMKMTPVLTEFGRVRVSPFTAVSMAMNILEQMIANGSANKGVILSSLTGFDEPQSLDRDQSEDEDEDESIEELLSDD